MIYSVNILSVRLNKLIKRMTYISCLCKIQHIIVRLFYTHVIFIDHKRHIRLMIQSVAVSIHLMTCMNIKLSGCLCHPQRTCLKRNIRIRSVYGNRPYSLKIFGIFYDSHYFFFIAVRTRNNYDRFHCKIRQTDSAPLQPFYFRSSCLPQNSFQRSFFRRNAPLS